MFVGAAGYNAGGGTDSAFTTGRIADLFISKGQELTIQQIQSIYNNGNYRPFETGGIRYKYTQAGQSGQKYSMKAELNRSTTAVSPAIVKAGMLGS